MGENWKENAQCFYYTAPGEDYKKLGIGIPSGVTLDIYPNPESLAVEWSDYFTEIFKPFFLVPKIKSVIFHDPATIIYWEDGTKTVVKCQPGDTFEKEKGFMAAVLKKIYGNNNEFNKVIKKWCEDE